MFRKQILTLRDWISESRRQATLIEEAHGGDPRGELVGIIGQRRRDADDLEKLLDHHWQVIAEEGFDEADSDFLIRHILGEKKIDSTQ